MKTTKKALSVLLSVLMIALTVSCLSAGFTASALAATGKCGNDVYWSFNSSTGVLTITGTGMTYSYSWNGSNTSPFYQCDDIRTVNFNNDVTQINDYLFYGCKNLTTVNLSFSMKEIGYYAFGGCTGLTSVTLPNYVETIGPDAFANCTGLKSIFIPSSVTGILNRAFDRCSALTDVYYGGTAEQWMNINIVNSDSPLKTATKHWNSTGPSVISVNRTIEPAGAGVVVGTGAYYKNREVTLTATPNTGYKFIGWYKNGGKVSSNEVYTFTATETVTLTAKFEEAGTCTLTVTAEPAEGGSVTGGGTYTKGGTATLTATPKPGYRFVQWERYARGLDGQWAWGLQSTESTYTLTVESYFSSNTKIRAVFEVDPDYVPGTPDPGTPASGCPWCGGQHNGFFQGIIGWFHSIFAKLFGARY